MAEIGKLFPESDLPVLVTATAAEAELAAWVNENTEWVKQTLLQTGGILFRGFGVDTEAKFQQFVNTTGEELLSYNEPTSPRTKLTDSVYTSTEHPSDQHILLHNEMSYSASWPMKIWFCSTIPAEQGGETPIADVRRVYEGIDPAIRAKFAEKGWMLVRNFVEGIGLPWQTVFHTEVREEVEVFCREHQIECEWQGERLKTWQWRPAVRQHPATADMLWFNHAAFYHESSLQPEMREMLVEWLGSDGLPYNTFYGDGTPIEDEVVAAVRAAYEQATLVFPWQKGDVLLLDNMMVAHARNPFVGERRTLVAMSDAMSLTEKDAAALASAMTLLKR